MGWTLTNKLDHTIDVFQRSLLRRILNISWKDKVTNDELYEKTKAEKWSNNIKRRRLNWLGHLMRLPDETPAKQALEESHRKARKPQGRPKLTWMKQVQNQLKDMKIDYNDIHNLTSDRTLWKQLISEGAMSSTTNQA